MYALHARLCLGRVLTFMELSTPDIYVLHCSAYWLCDLVWSLVVMLSTLFPLDPTLTVNNVCRIMEKVESKVKGQFWNDVLQHTIISEQQLFFEEDECADIYVNCCYSASWEHLARTLYRHWAAVEEVRSYLPPRGEPHFGMYNRNCCFNVYTEENDLLWLLHCGCLCFSNLDKEHTHHIHS